MRLCIFLFLICIGSSSISYAQKISTFEVDLPVSTNGIEVPVSIGLDEITSLDGSLLTLVLVNGSERIPIPFQISGNQQRILHWVAKSDGNP